MGKVSKFRDCPAVGRAIKPVECGQNRGLNYQCPPECPYCPWGYSNYESLRDLDKKIDNEALRFFKDLVGEVPVHNMLAAGEEAGEIAFFNRLVRAVYRDLAADGKTAYEHWEASGWKGLSGDEIFVAGLRKGLRMEVIEVIAVLDDQQLECRFALRTESERFIVRDMSLAKAALRGSVLIGRVIPYPHFHVMHGIAMPFEPAPGESAAEALRQITGTLGGPDPMAEDFLPWLDERFAEVADEIEEKALEQRRTIFENSDLKQCVAVYKLRNGRQVLEEMIAEYPEMSRRNPDDDDEGEGGALACFDWLREGRSREWESALPPAMRSWEGDLGSKMWGSLRIFGNRMEIESMGRVRYGPMREMVKEFFGEAVEFEREVVVDLGRQVMEGGGSPAVNSPAEEIPHEIKVGLLEQAFRSHYQKFLSDPIPALNGYSPRDAARDPALRPRLVELMKGHLHTVDGHSRKEGHAFSIDWVLDELGLEELKPGGGVPVRPASGPAWPVIPREVLDAYMQTLFSEMAGSEIPEFVFDLVESMPPHEFKNHELDFMEQMMGLICCVYTRDQGVPPEATADEILEEVGRVSGSEMLAAEKQGLEVADFFELLAKRSPQPVLADTVFKMAIFGSVDKREKQKLGIPGLGAKNIRHTVVPVIVLNCDALIRILARPV